MVKRSTSFGFYHHLVLGIFSTVVGIHRLEIRFIFIITRNKTYLSRSELDGIWSSDVLTIGSDSSLLFLKLFVGVGKLERR